MGPKFKGPKFPPLSPVPEPPPSGMEFFKPSPLLFISVVDPDPGGNNLGKIRKNAGYLVPVPING